MTNLSMLLYGYSGSGKTALGVSAGWDWKAKELIRPFKWVTIGREDNPALGVPEKYRVRFTSPTLDDTGWADKFQSFLKWVKIENEKALVAGKDLPVQALIIDGMSEFDLLFEQSFWGQHGDDDKFAMWNKLMDKCFAAMQLLDPNELHCHVIVTARVMERKEERKNRKGDVIVKGTAEYVAADYLPSMRGGFKDNFPHYFNMVLYMERDVVKGKLDGKIRDIPVHRIKMIPDREFLVKNHWEYEWLTGGKSDILDNASFTDILEIVEELNG